MATKTLCDGSVVEYEPVLEDVECEECGHVTGHRVVNEPKFHGTNTHRDGRIYCSRCGDEFVGIDKINVIAVEGLVKNIEDLVASNRPILRYLKAKV